MVAPTLKDNRRAESRLLRQALRYTHPPQAVSLQVLYYSHYLPASRWHSRRQSTTLKPMLRFPPRRLTHVHKAHRFIQPPIGQNPTKRPSKPSTSRESPISSALSNPEEGLPVSMDIACAWKRSTKSQAIKDHLILGEVPLIKANKKFHKLENSASATSQALTPSSSSGKQSDQPPGPFATEPENVRIVALIVLRIPLVSTRRELAGTIMAVRDTNPRAGVVVMTTFPTERQGRICLSGCAVLKDPPRDGGGS